jgi:hypothetical protein
LNQGIFLSLSFRTSETFDTHGAFLLAKPSWYDVEYKSLLILCNSSTDKSFLHNNVCIVSLYLLFSAVFAWSVSHVIFVVSNHTILLSFIFTHCSKREEFISSIISFVSNLSGFLYTSEY